jgi:hypothetical protein
VKKTGNKIIIFLEHQYQDRFHNSVVSAVRVTPNSIFLDESHVAVIDGRELKLIL